MSNQDSDGEDLQAIHRTLNGDENAFRFLVLKYADRMLSFCRSRTATEDDAADAAQETFLRAYKSLKNFKVGASFAAWLFAIAANRTRTGWAKAFSEKLKTEKIQAEEAVRPEENPEAVAISHIEGEQLRTAVDSLPTELKLAVELYYYAELSIRDAATTLDISEENLKSRLFRARKKLKIILENNNQPGAEEV